MTEGSISFCFYDFHFLLYYSISFCKLVRTHRWQEPYPPDSSFASTGHGVPPTVHIAQISEITATSTEFASATRQGKSRIILGRNLTK